MRKRVSEGGPAYTREPRQFELSFARTARTGPVSGVVVIRDSFGSGYAHVKFSDRLEQAVGRLLPRGVSLDDPAYLRALELPNRRGWRIYAQYLSGDHRRLLWVTEERPKWLKTIHRELK